MKKLTFICCLALLIIDSGCKNGKKGTVSNKQDSFVEFTSNPSGALVEIGVEIEGNNFKPGTGRQIGATPTKVALTEEDVNDQGMVNFIMLRGGLTTVGQLKVDKPLVEGKTYNYNQNY